MKRGEQRELFTNAMDGFTKVLNEAIEKDSDTQKTAYLAIIAQSLALISDRLMDITLHLRENA